MRLGSRHVIALVIGALMLVGTGVALGQSSSPSPSASSSSSASRKAIAQERRNAFLDILARRLGIQRAKLDAASKAMALDEVAWAQQNGFLTKSEADVIRERINASASRGIGLGPHPFLGLGFGGFGRDHGFIRGGMGRDSGPLSAAATYLGLSERALLDALRSKTLAQVARDRGKSVDGLGAALRTATKARQDAAVTAGEVTPAQEKALLDRFDSSITDALNGMSPVVTELARRLGIDRARLVTAMKNSAIELVDRALAEGRITKAQAAAIKQRIRMSPTWPMAGFLGRFGHRLGRPGCFGPGHFGPDGPLSHHGWSGDFAPPMGDPEVSVGL